MKGAIFNGEHFSLNGIAFFYSRLWIFPRPNGRGKPAAIKILGRYRIAFAWDVREVET